MSFVLHLGDCLDPVTGLASLADKSALCIVSDPPYGMAYQSGWKESSHIVGDGDTDARDSALAWYGSGPALIFGRWSVMRPAGTRMVLYWNKGDWPGMGDLSLPWGPSTEEIYVIGSGFVGRRRGQIIHDPHRPAADAVHPNEKPLALMTELVRACPPGAIILDPFAGSGTTGVAAIRLGRNFIGWERDPKHHAIALKRLQAARQQMDLCA